MITLRQFEIFVEVVRSGSFRRCAERLGLSQVSVSEHVRALEQRLGTPLFVRHAGGPPTITAKGQAAHARITDILAAVDDLVADMDERASAKRRRLGAAVHSFLMRDLAPTLASFRAAHPHVELEVETGVHFPEILLDMVARRTLDLAYFFELDAVPRTRFVRNEPLAVFVGVEHPLAVRPIVAVEELAAIPAIQLTGRDPLHSLVDRAFAAVGLRNRQVGLESDEFGLILGSVQRCLGYACLFEASAEEPGRLLGLKKLTLDRPLPPLQVRLACRPTADRDPLLMDLSEVLADRWRNAGAPHG